MLAGPRDVIRDCIRHRRMMGGGMRQIGILAAAGLYALDHHLDRLGDDHDNATFLASRLRASPRLRLVAGPVQTNIVIFSLAADAPDAAAGVAAARELGRLVLAVGPPSLPTVTRL